MVLYNQTSAIMQDLGDSRSPLIFLGISSILNIGADLALVRPMEQGEPRGRRLSRRESLDSCVSFI